MAYLEELKIFLASPGDVSKERHYVDEVVDEVNRTVAAKKGFWLRVIRSERDAFPGYGKDGQAILNEQIGDMQEYDLLVSMLWNRIGTPTPRADSGTLEEVERAVKSWLRKRKPQIWIYFRQSAAHFTTEEELEQRKGVLAFRTKFQKEKRGLFRDYKSPADFCKQFREQLNLWLSQREEEKTRSRATTNKQGTKATTTKNQSTTSPRTQKEAKLAPTTKGKARTTKDSPVSEKDRNHSTSSKLSTTQDRKKTASSAPAKAGTAKTTTATKPSTTHRESPASKTSAARSTGVIKSPGNWIMLDGKFFQTKLSNTQPDRSILLQFSPKDLEQAAELKAFHPGEFHNRRQVSFADSHEAGIMQVSSVTNESTDGKTSFSITLNQIQRSQNSGFGEVNYQNYNADKVAELRARQILLGEPLPTEIGRFIPTKITGPHNHTTTIENGIFPDLWAELQTKPSLFLPKAWLWAAYSLKMSQVIEDILELELGPIKNKMMPVRFRGKRKQFYSNHAPSTISIVGSCILNA